jgi:hypothetical protein
MDQQVDPDPVAEPCSCSAAVDARPDERFERRLEMLAELADVGLDLAKAVAVHTKALMALEDKGWSGCAPKDPSAAFARLAQSVRRTLALEVHLREGLEAGRSSLFAGPPRRGIDLNPSPEIIAAATRGRDIQSRVECAPESAPRPESLQRDLGRLLDDPERFLEVSIASTDSQIAGLCANVGLDVSRVRYENGAWMVKADPAAPLGRDEPLKTWRPPMPGAESEPSDPETGPPRRRSPAASRGECAAMKAWLRPDLAAPELRSG